MRRVLVGLGAMLSLGACHYSLPPVPMRGATADIAALAGEWVGSYEGLGSGRSGGIVFLLSSGKDSAFGDVMMTVDGDAIPIRAADPAAQHAAHVRTPRALRIDFVRVSGDELAGALEPYIAPDCDCVVTTRFIGRRVGDAITGTFRTHSVIGWTQEGKWAVQRRR